MKMVEESERMWDQIDSNTKSIGDHCIRLTTLEQDHLWRDKNKANRVMYILAGIIVLEFLFLAWDKVG